MTNSPQSEPRKPRESSPILSRRATATALSSAAERYASRHGLAEALAGLDLPQACQAGDLVSVTAGGARHDFAVIRRRWHPVDGAMVLELTLDHPARS